MIPLTFAALGGGLLKLLAKVPREVWRLLLFAAAVGAALLYARAHWIDEGLARGQATRQAQAALIAALSASLERQNTENARRIAAAEAQKQQAQEATDLANAAARSLNHKVAELDRQLAAITDPVCRAELEKAPCAAFQ